MNAERLQELKQQHANAEQEEAKWKETRMAVEGAIQECLYSIKCLAVAESIATFFQEIGKVNEQKLKAVK